MTELPRSLSEISDALTALESKAAGLVPPDPVDPIPDDRHHGSRTAALALMTSIHEADPGVWVPIAELGSYRHDRVRFQDLQVHLGWLVQARHVERITVAPSAGTSRASLLRLRTDVDAVDTEDIAARVSAELAAVGHRLDIHPARPTWSHFHQRVVTVPDGTTYQCYRRWHRWEPRLERIEPQKTS